MPKLSHKMNLLGVSLWVGLSRLAFFWLRKATKKELKQTAQSLTQIELRFLIYDFKCVIIKN